MNKSKADESFHTIQTVPSLAGKHQGSKLKLDNTGT